jgi:hypothetical protein
MAILDELRDERTGSSRGRVAPRGVKRKMSNFPLRPRERTGTKRPDYVPRVVASAP